MHPRPVLKEQVRFDNGVVSFDWETYPVLKFSEVPEIDCELINCRDAVPLGARIRDLPLTRERIMASLLKD